MRPVLVPAVAAASLVAAGGAAAGPYSNLLAPAGTCDADISCGEFTHTPCGNPFTDVFATYLDPSQELGTRNAPAPAKKPVRKKHRVRAARR